MQIGNERTGLDRGMIRVVSWALVELVGEGTVLREEYETEEQAQAALWEMLDDAADQEQRDRLSDVLSLEKRDEERRGLV